MTIIDFSANGCVWTIGYFCYTQSAYAAMTAEGCRDDFPTEQGMATWPACLFDAENTMSQKEAHRRGYSSEI